MKKTLLLTFAAILLTIPGCRKTDSTAPVAASSTTTPPEAAALAVGIPGYLSKLTPNELRWGISPTRNDKVTYQPDVIIMERGSDAIRARGSRRS